MYAQYTVPHSPRRLIITQGTGWHGDGMLLWPKLLVDKFPKGPDDQGMGWQVMG